MLRRGILAGAAMLWPATALGAIDAAEVQTNLNHVWTMLAAGLVMMMQVGFLLLEAGAVRSKNSINVAQKNFFDMTASIAAFWIVGFAVMFGTSHGGLFGWSSELATLRAGEDWSFTFFVFQAVFCGTAATIVSGAVAERCSFHAYLIITLVIAVIVYPVSGHWAWGNLLYPENPAWLADMGFIDFAGSTVVHSVGAWAALAVCLVIGPRVGRFDEAGRPVEIGGHSPVLSAAGAIILLVGWIGFNGGSTTAGTPVFAHIVMNTIIAACFGGLGGLLYGRLRDGLLKPDRSINGLLGGLVAITAGCDVLTIDMAAITGLLGGLVALLACDALLHLFKIDDVVGAIGVHGFGGVFGTIALAVFADQAALPLPRWQQIGVQALGAGATFIWVFGVSMAVLMAARMVMRLRVSREEEIEGMNRIEHGVTLGTGHLQLALVDLLKGKADFSARIKVEPGDEAAELTELFNMLLGRLDNDARADHLRDEAQQGALRDQAAADERVVEEINTLIQRAAEGDLTGRVSLTGKVGALRAVASGVNALFDAMRGVTEDLSAALGSMAAGDLTGRIVKRRGGAFGSIGAAYNSSADSLAQTVSEIGGSAEQLDGMAATLGTAAASLRETGAEQRERTADAASALDEAHKSASESVAAASSAKGQAESARRLVADADLEGGTAAARMETVVEAMAKARQMVETIDGIARQTNLLAINAAIEAARAGQNGGAFAVVAEEVRSLSQNVTEAAQEIGGIMERCTALAGKGAETVRGIRLTLTRIGESASSVSDSVSGMAERLAEDALRIDRLHASMGALKEGADHAAALSGQASDAAASIAEASASLRNSIARFETERKDARMSTISAA